MPDSQEKKRIEEEESEPDRKREGDREIKTET